MGRVKWNDDGRRSVESRAYRYLSPLFSHTREISGGSLDGGDVVSVVGAGLVNTPAFDMPALAARQHQEDTVLKKILEALGLAAGAGEEAAITAIAALKEKLATATAAASSPPVDRFVPREMYATALARAATAEAKLAEQAGAALESEIKTELDAAQEAGKLTPAQRPWFESQCRREGGLGEIRELLGMSSPAPGPGGGSAAPPAATASGFASAEEAAIASMFGRDAKFLDEHSPREAN